VLSWLRNISAFHGTQKIIIVFARVDDWVLS
jgi:hypothetical protein